MLKLFLTISGKTSATRKRRMSPASVEVLDSGLVPEQVEHRASLLLRSYAENADNKFIPKRPKRSHEPWYLVEQRWFSKLKAGAEPEKWFKCMDPGPLDNSSLMDPHTPSKLKRRLVENIDYVLVNEGFWRSIQNWYKISGPEIARYVAGDGTVEVYPLVFKVSFTRNTEGQEWDESTEVEMEFGKDTTIEGLYSAIEDRIGLKGLIIKIKFSAYNKLEPLRYDNESAKRTLREIGCGEENWLLVTMPTQSEALSVVRKPAVSASSSSALITTNFTSAFSPSKPPSGNTGDLRGTKKHDGLCGLNNLGNTCYMNAVLQCLSFTSPLRAQLLSGEAQKRVNVDSKFGRKGEVVRELTKLLREMWNGKHRTVAPHGFKQSLDGWTTLFQGYHQQDAHELLAFLLDGLHEDTNFGNASSQPSVVESIFGGNLTSRLTCPECRTESVTNEPFQVLSLELPLESADQQNTGKSVQIFPITGPARRVSLGGSKSESVEEIMSRLKAIEPSKKFVLAQVHTRNTNNFRHLETLLSSTTKVSWENDDERTLAAFEVDEVVSNEHVLVHCINRFNGKMLGSPFVVSIHNSASRKQLLSKVVSRLGLENTVDIQARFSLKTCPKDRKLTDAAHEFVVDDSRCPTSLSYNAVIIVEWSESPSNDVLERFSSNLPIKLSDDSSEASEKPEPESTVNSLRSCLDAFCAAETLEGDDLWLCPKCEVKRAAVKQISLATKMPEVFVLHLKRFNSMGAKLQFPVTYSPLLQVNGADYELYGVIRHHGSTISLGHYDCLVRSGINGKWYQFNDSTVSSVPDVTIGKVTLPAIGWNDPSAYIFFYRKRRVSAAL